MKTIELLVQDEYVAGHGVVVGAKGSHDSTILRVTFGDNWEGLSKYATFRDARGENPVVVILTTDLLVEGESMVYDITVPAEAMREEGLCTVTFTGYTIVNGNEESTATNTTMCKLRVLPSDYILASDSSITPTIAQQLQAEIDSLLPNIVAMDEKLTAAEEFKDEAERQAQLSEASASASSGYADNSLASATESERQAQLSEGYANDSSDSATESESYAHGGTDTRVGEDFDNSKYYFLQTRELIESLGGFMRYRGTISFSQLPPISLATSGDIYNINEEFTTTSDFVEGAGHIIPSGANVCATTNNKWDVLSGLTIESLSKIIDVDVATVTSGQTIVWNSSNNKWENKDILARGGSQGQVYMKQSSTDFDGDWESLSATDISYSQSTSVADEIASLIENDEHQLQLMATEYDPTESYVAGDYCSHNGSIYKCIGATTGTWDSSKWSAVVIGDVLQQINTDLSDGISDLTNKISDKSNKIIVETKTGSMTMGGTYSQGSVSIAIAKSGYTPIAIGSIQITNSHGMPLIGRYNFTNTTFTMDCHSAIGAVPYTETVAIRVVYMKN